MRSRVKAGQEPGKWNKGQMPDSISIISGARAVRVPIEEIEVVEQVGRSLHFVTADDEYSCFESIETVAPLFEAKDFYRAMKKVLINFNKVVEMNENEIIFISGASLIMGRNNFLAAKRAFKQYMVNYSHYTLWKSTASMVSDIKDAKNIG